MDSTLLLETLRQALPEVTYEAGDGVDQPFLIVPREHLVATARVLRDLPELRFSFLAELTAVDYLPREPRFEVVYHLASLGVPNFPVRGEEPTPKRLRMKVRVPGHDPAVPSLCEVWPNANWYEREVWDMFGIVFGGHPDLRRILMPDEWEGHPARKDYPIQVNVPVRASMPLQVTEEEFVRNIQAQRRLAERGPSRGSAPGKE